MSQLALLGAGPSGANIEVPQRISNLVYWFRADTECFTDLAGTIQATDGESVRAIGDKSGNLTTIPTVDGDVRRPIYRDSGINGLPTLDYDGINDAFRILGASATPFEVDRVDPFSIFFIVNTNGSYGLFVKLTGGTGYELRVLQPKVRFNLSSSGFGSIIIDTNSNPITNNIDHIIMITYDGSSTAAGVNIYVDSTTAESMQAPITDNLTGTTISAANLTIGSVATSFMNGDNPEHAFYDKELSGTEIADIMTYGSDKYGITIS